MELREISSVCDLLNIMEAWAERQSIFRGVSSSRNHSLIPAIGRCPPFRGTSRRSMEGRIFRRFKEKSLPHLVFAPRDEWEWLAVAQHFGLPTRLLDWTRNPLVAAFFAVERFADEDSAVYVCEVGGILDKARDPNPLDVTSVVMFQPPAISERIVRQSGLFTAHHEVERPFEPDSLWKLVIPRDRRLPMKRELFKLGVSRGSLFPGLDGVAADVAWEGSEIH